MICGPCGRAADWDRAFANGQPVIDRSKVPGTVEHCGDSGCMCQHRPVQPKDETKGTNG